MGVQNLWDLLSPVGRRVSVETLAGKRLAIDASIWMIQFMKAMRDERGEMVRNAHLLGFFRRICKLLFLRTKPVFVFDGGTPALKRRTVIARRRQRENAQAKVRKTAEKLLLNELKKKRLQELAKELEEQRVKSHGMGKNVALFEAGPVEKNDGCVGSLNQEKIDAMLAASLAAEEHDLHNAGASTSYDALHGQDGGPSTSAFAKFMDDVEDEDDEEMILPTTNGNIDPTVLAALPPSMQLDLLAQMRERLMAENRQKYQKVKKAPQKFSELQIETYLKTVAFRREIDEVQKAASGKGLGGLQTARIASEANKEFIFSSSFTGDKDALASAGTKKSSEDQDGAALECSSTLPTTLASGLTPSIVSEPSGNEAPALSGNEAPASSGNEAPASSGNEAPASSGNETRKRYGSNIQTYRDERGHMRVSRVRAMGIRMTRDLQRNLDLMKEMEQDMVSVDVPANAPVNPIREDVGNNKIIWETLSEVSSEKCSTTEKHDNNRLVTNIGTSLEISFEDDGQYIPVDNDDDVFAHLVAGDPVPISSAGHSVSQDHTLESDSDCEWEEGNVGIQNEQFKSIAKKSQLEVNDDETELQVEGGINSISKEASSYPAVSMKTKTRGSIEEEAALQEAIARSLEDSMGDMDASNNSERGNTAINLMSAAPPDQDNVIDVPKSGSIDSSVSGTVLLHDMTKSKSLDILCSPDMIPMPSTSYACQSLEMEVDKPCKNCSPLDAGCLVKCGMSFSGETAKTQSMAAVRTIEKSHDVLLDVPGESSCGTLHSHVIDADFADPLHLITKNTSQTDGAAPLIRHSSEAPGISINLEKSKEPASYAVGVNRRASNEDLIHDVEERELSLGSIDNQKDNIQVAGANMEEEFRFLDEECAYLEDEQRKLERNAASVNNEMFVECQELLQMFGLPYIIAPMEAEAQCAYMELAGLVEGVVTDDSDVFLFGACSVYKNIFDDRKYVETYLMKDIENELGLSREKLISLALLLGSDYTEGVSGIGIVNAIEVLNAFPEEDGLSKFREWVESPDPTILGISGMPRGSISKKRRSKSSDTLMNVSKDGMDVISSDCDDHEKTKDKHELENIPKITQNFMDKHRNVSKNWHIPSYFPSEAVISAYASPQVDKSTEPCAWGKPDQFSLHRLCWEKFGWASQKADELLLPVLKEYNKRETQLRMEAFYTFNEKFAKIRSKRIRQAVKGITGNQSLESSNNPKVGGQKNKSKTQTKESIKSKTHEKNCPSEKEQRCLLEKETSATARGRRKAHAGGKRKRKGTNHIEFSDSDSKDDDQKLQSEKVETPDRVRRSKRSRKAANYAESDDATKEEKPGNEEFVNDDSVCYGEMRQSTAAGVSSVPDDRILGDYVLKGSGFCADVEEPENETCTLEGVAVDRQYLHRGGGFCFDDGDTEHGSAENEGNVGELWSSTPLQSASDSGAGTRSSNSRGSQQHQQTQNDRASGSPSELGKAMLEVKDDTISPMKALSGMPYLRRKRKKSS